jgi:hypothetical protein
MSSLYPGHIKMGFIHYEMFNFAYVPLSLLLSTGLLPVIYMAATVVLKQMGTCSIEAIPRVPTEQLSVCGSRAEGLV